MLILGIYCGHDANACLIQDGKIIISIEKERITRKKGDRGNADICIEYCLNKSGFSISDIDYVATSRTIPIGHKRSGNILTGKEYDNVEQLFSMHDIELFGHQLKAYSIQHHLGHVANAFFLSTFKEAAVLSIDGWGDFTATMLAQAQENHIDILAKPLCNLGFVWTAVSTTLGFGARYNEGKIMGLSAYGEPKYYKDLLNWCGGDFDNFRIQGKDRSYEKALQEIWHGNIHNLFEAKEQYHDIRFQDDNSQWHGIPIFQGVVQKGNPMFKGNRDVASTIQKLTEDIMIYFANKLYDETQIKNLCIVGGVGLNCVANRKVLDNTPFENIFIPPAPHDGGLSIGLALYLYHVILRGNKRQPIKNAYTGGNYSDEEIQTAISNKKLFSKQLSETTVLQETARLLSQGYIIAWFQDRSEIGPRALGNRSIICDPRIKQMKATLNFKVKHREDFRPFAPSVLSDYTNDFFDLDYLSPFMLLIANVKEEKKNDIPAVVHIDNTARLQTVSKKANIKYYRLIEEFFHLTGMPLILNTSFNIAGEPIVETPEDAVNCFCSTQIDYLVINNTLVSKTDNF